MTIDTSVKGGRGSRTGEAHRQVLITRTGAKESRLGIRRKPKSDIQLKNTGTILLYEPLIAGRKEGGKENTTRGGMSTMKTELETRALLNVKELCEYLGIGQTKARELLSNPSNGFTVRIGNRLYAHKGKLDNWLLNQIL